MTKLVNLTTQNLLILLLFVNNFNLFVIIKNIPLLFILLYLHYISDNLLYIYYNNKIFI